MIFIRNIVVNCMFLYSACLLRNVMLLQMMYWNDIVNVAMNIAIVAYMVLKRIFTFTFKHLADAFIQSDLHSCYTYFSQYMCSLGIEPTTFALLAQCSTTEPQEHYKYINIFPVPWTTLEMDYSFNWGMNELNLCVSVKLSPGTRASEWSSPISCSSSASLSVMTSSHTTSTCAP